MKKIYPILILVLSSHALVATPGEEKKPLLKVTNDQKEPIFLPKHEPSLFCGVLSTFCCLCSCVRDCHYNKDVKRIIKHAQKKETLDTNVLAEIINDLPEDAQNNLLYKAAASSDNLLLLKSLLSFYDANTILRRTIDGHLLGTSYDTRQSLLAIALSNDNFQGALSLIEQGATLNPKSASALSDDALTFIAEHIEDPNTPFPSKELPTLLHRAANAGNDLAVQALLRRDNLIISANSYGQKPGTLARKNHYAEIADAIEQRVIEQ